MEWLCFIDTGQGGHRRRKLGRCNYGRVNVHPDAQHAILVKIEEVQRMHGVVVDLDNLEIGEIDVEDPNKTDAEVPPVTMTDLTINKFDGKQFQRLLILLLTNLMTKVNKFRSFLHAHTALTFPTIFLMFF